jgi:UPF0716 protein FxsA
MPVFQILLLAFLTIPLAEIYVLLKVGGIVGLLPTVALVVFTAVLGAILVRAQGFSTIVRVHQSIEHGELPAMALLEGALILVAGALLLTPGFLTDTFGFACLIPPLRQRVIMWALTRGQWRPPPTDSQRPPGGHVIEGEYRREDD